MNMKFKHICAAMMLSVFGTGAVFAMAQAREATLLETLDTGLWEFRAVGGGIAETPVKQLCASSGKMLAQIQHGAGKCEQTVLRSNAATVTISYSCSGRGQGLTRIRKESSRLIHIDSQGIYNNSPFSFTVEARRTAACSR